MTAARVPSASTARATTPSAAGLARCSPTCAPRDLLEAQTAVSHGIQLGHILRRIETYRQMIISHGQSVAARRCSTVLLGHFSKDDPKEQC